MGFKLLEDVEVVVDFPGLYLRDVEALVIADLHIGYEHALQKQGIYIPKSTYSKTKMLINDMICEVNPKKIVMLGDVKHEFGIPSDQEWIEVKDLLKWLTDLGLKVCVVRGNHDNYIISILKRYGVELHDPVMFMGRYALLHGHKLLENIPESVGVLLLGHEHPAIAIRDRFGVKKKFKCFLRGYKDNIAVIVLPAISPLASGSTLNESLKDQLLSPILRDLVDIDGFKPIIIEPRAGVYEFPELQKLRIALTQF
ncbi:MAG: metallophosphoesterase [Candidatus Nezhaarchaeota archaeon]|nr:metallophosphoesterase [Candidatus Nezhaarchaeota archaeon]MCX8142597.1 metallophosphoesterase [Candidatus Nezhaarchaeota archaeon]